MKKNSIPLSAAYPDKENAPSHFGEKKTLKGKEKPMSAPKKSIRGKWGKKKLPALEKEAGRARKKRKKVSTETNCFRPFESK